MKHELSTGGSVVGTTDAETRAEIARLTLRLRQTQRRIDQADESASIDLAQARSALVHRLGPLLDERRSSLQTELEAVRVQMAERVDAARQEAATIMAGAEAAAAECRAERARRVAAREAEAMQRAMDARVAREAEAVRQFEFAGEAALAGEAELALQAQLARQAELGREAERRAEAERQVERIRRAEALREAERQIEAARQVEAARQAQAEQEAARQVEAARQAQAERQAAEAQRALVLRQAEEARQADLARREKVARQAALARQAEAARQAEFTRQAEAARRAEFARQEELVRQEERRRHAEQAHDLQVIDEARAYAAMLDVDPPILIASPPHQHLAGSINGVRSLPPDRMPPDPVPLSAPHSGRAEGTGFGHTADRLFTADLPRVADVPTGRLPITLGTASDSSSHVDVHSAFAPVVREVPQVIETRLVVDSEAFARVFATAIASVIQERNYDASGGSSAPSQQTMTVGGMQPYAMASHMMMQPAPATAKTSGGFWANARHLDVLLLGFTTVIVMVVLGAWLA